MARILRDEIRWADLSTGPWAKRERLVLGLLARCEAGEVAGVTSVVVVVEVAHRLMMIEAVAAGLVSGKDLVKKLRSRPDVVARLHVYQEQVERIPLMGVNVLPLDVGTLLRSGQFRRQYGLLANDSLVAAAAREAGVAQLASADPDFERVKETGSSTASRSASRSTNRGSQTRR